MARSLQGYDAKLRLREKVANTTYAREWYTLCRSYHRCFGGIGGCTTAPRGVGTVAGDTLWLDNRALHYRRPLYGPAGHSGLSSVVAGYYPRDARAHRCNLWCYQGVARSGGVGHSMALPEQIGV